MSKFPRLVVSTVLLLLVWGIGLSEAAKRGAVNAEQAVVTTLRAHGHHVVPKENAEPANPWWETRPHRRGA